MWLLGVDAPGSIVVTTLTSMSSAKIKKMKQGNINQIMLHCCVQTSGGCFLLSLCNNCTLLLRLEDNDRHILSSLLSRSTSTRWRSRPDRCLGPLAWSRPFCQQLEHHRDSCCLEESVNNQMMMSCYCLTTDGVTSAPIKCSKILLLNTDYI